MAGRLMCVCCCLTAAALLTGCFGNLAGLISGAIGSGGESGGGNGGGGGGGTGCYITGVTVTPTPEQVLSGGVVSLHCAATSQGCEGKAFTYAWSADGEGGIPGPPSLGFRQASDEAGKFSGDGADVTWAAPDPGEGLWTIACTVATPDGQQGQGTASVRVNDPPVVQTITATPAEVMPGEQTALVCEADDPSWCQYEWTCPAGRFDWGSTDSQTVWTAPSEPGEYEVTCTVTDDGGLTAAGTVSVAVLAPGGIGITIQALR